MAGKPLAWILGAQEVLSTQRPSLVVLLVVLT